MVALKVTIFRLAILIAEKIKQENILGLIP